jgi:hypothetical protein
LDGRRKVCESQKWFLINDYHAPARRGASLEKELFSPLKILSLNKDHFSNPEKSKA